MNMRNHTQKTRMMRGSIPQGYRSGSTELVAQFLKSITGLHAVDALRARSQQDGPVHDLPSMEHSRMVLQVPSIISNYLED